jgi:hypothetical protein
VNGFLYGSSAISHEEYIAGKTHIPDLISVKKIRVRKSVFLLLETNFINGAKNLK